MVNIQIKIIINSITILIISDKTCNVIVYYKLIMRELYDYIIYYIFVINIKLFADIHFLGLSGGYRTIIQIDISGVTRKLPNRYLGTIPSEARLSHQYKNKYYISYLQWIYKKLIHSNLISQAFV